MAGIDNRIMTMKFDNAQFEAGAKTSLSTIQKIKESMNFGSIGASASKALGGISGLFAKFGIKNPFATAEKGAADLGKAAQGTVGGIASIDGAVTGISGRFVAMSTVAITALSNIVTAAQRAGTQMVSSLTVDPIKGGLEEYETNLNSIQTILANTKVSGANLNDVNSALEELNHYSDKTIYNFSEMARNIGTFTAAGVDLETSVSSIKGIANLAALSGSNSQQASTAMYQLSQEIAAGRVSLMGWNSVVNAGMGGSTFQRALVTTAQTMGTLSGKTVEFQGKMKNATIDGMSFRDSIMAKPGEQSWLTNKVLTSTLAQFTNDMTDAELAAEGFNKQQIADIQEMAKTAEDAATKVKTLSGVFDTAKEVVGSGWAKSWQLVFGDFKEAREFFTDFSNGFNDILGGIADRRNELLAEWKLGGGRDMAIDALKRGWESILTIIKPIGQAFRDIFPATTSDQLLEMTSNAYTFFKELAIGKDTAEGLRETFRGFFAIFSIAGKVISAVGSGIGTIFGEISKGSGGILNFTGGIGNLLVALNDFLEESGVLKGFFQALGKIIAVPLKLIGQFAATLAEMFTGFDSGGAEKLGQAVGNLKKRSEQLESVGERLSDVFQKIGDVVSDVAQYIGEKLSKLGELIASAITPENLSAGLDVINTTLLGGLVLMFRKFFSGGLNIDLSGGLFDGIKETLGAATGALENMQATLKADILIKIAAALAILTGSLVVLAMIDGKDLAKGLTTMTIGFAGLGGALVALSTAINTIGAAKLPFIATAMVGIATAMLILSGALKVMASIAIDDLVKGLFGMGTALTLLVIALATMAKISGGMLRAATALNLLAVAIGIMAVALKIFASMSWEEMTRGLLGLVGALAALATGMKLMPKGMLLQATAVLALSVALNALGIALKIFASMNWEEMTRGLLGLVGALAGISIGMQLMPKKMLLQAGALVALGAALNLIAFAVKNMGGMGWEQIAKGLVTLAGSLVILAGGLYLMTGSLAGAAALAVAAGALAVLAPVLITLGMVQWETIIKSLAFLAGSLIILGGAGVLMAPLVPVLLGLGAAMLLIGGGFALAGAGAVAFATALAIVVGLAASGVQALVDTIGAIVSAIPKAMEAFGKGFVRMLSAISDNGPKFTEAMGKIVSNMLDAVIRNMPKIRQAFGEMVDTAVQVLRDDIPRLTTAGLDMIVGILRGLASRMGQIVDAGADVIVEFLKGIRKQDDRLADQAAKTIVSLVNAFSRAIDRNSEAIGRAAGKLGVAIIDGIKNAIWAGADEVNEATDGVAGAALSGFKIGLGIFSPSRKFAELGWYAIQGLVLGIRDSTGLVEKETAAMAQSALSTLSATMSGISDTLDISADLNPVITPVLDLSQMTREANKMSSILAVAPIMPTVSYQTAADISAMTQRSSDPDDGPDDPTDSPGTGGGDVNLTLELHSPKPIDSVESYRAGKTLIAIAKEALK